MEIRKREQFHFEPCTFQLVQKTVSKKRITSLRALLLKASTLIRHPQKYSYLFLTPTSYEERREISILFAIIHKRVRPSGARCQVVLESINRGEAVGYAAENKGRGLW